MNYELKLTHNGNKNVFLYHNMWQFILPSSFLTSLFCIQLPCKLLPKANLEKQYVIWPPVTLYSFAHQFPQDKVIKIRFGFHYQETRIILYIVCPPLRSLILLPQRTAISLACFLLWLNNVHQSTFWASTCSSGTGFFPLTYLLNSTSHPFLANLSSFPPQLISAAHFVTTPLHLCIHTDLLH